MKAFKFSQTPPIQRFCRRSWQRWLVIPLLFLIAACAGREQISEEPTPTPTVAAETATPVAEDKPVIVVAMDGDIDHIELMEFRSDAAYHATANLYEPLVLQKLVPGAERGVLEGINEYGLGLAEVTFSDDRLRATAKIRPDAQFHNGDPITAQAFKHTFDRAMVAPRSYIPLLVQFMGFDSPEDIVVVDDYTLEFQLDKTSPLFLPLLSFQVFGALDPQTTEEHATADDPWAFDWYRQNANSSGPYIITGWEPGREYSFEPNPNYWQGPDHFQNSKVIVKVIPSAAEREQLLKQGQVDLALGVPFEDVDTLKADPNVKVHTIESRRLFYLGMNNKIPPFDNQQVRQAISYAIPYQAIIRQVLYGYARQATSLIPEGMPTHTGEFWHYNTDLTQARRLLAEAGFPDGFEVALAVRLTTPSDIETAQLIQESLAQIGVQVTVSELDEPEFLGQLNAHELPFFIHDWYSWGNDPAFQLTFLVKCDAFTNYTDYCNGRVDQIIDEIIWNVDQTEREALMREAQQLIVEEAPWAFLYQPDWIVAVSPDFTGVAKVDELTLRFAPMGKERP